ncbi:MAG: rhomboid family intramembrane serine protease [Planctomycetota bacterium]|nr:rhomboid family intramembrane serine protease [Planctomycetota bacterium]
MRRRFLKRGVTWACTECGGRTATVSMMRRVFGKKVVEGLWKSSAAASFREGAKCPSCRDTMREVEVRGDDGAQTLDTCRRCQFVWFDPGEYHAIHRQHDPHLPPGPPPTEAEVLEEATLERSTSPRRRAWRQDRRHPDEGWKWLPGLLGMPVEFDAHPLKGRPYVTWILLSMISAIGIFTLQNLQPFIDRYAFLPADPWREGGVTFLTAFFLHGGWFHLIGNAYFLWIFGDNSEDALGVPRYVALIVLATIFGNVAHWATTSTPEIPCVGASGGISGVIAYYALRFPQMRLGLLFYFVWWLRLSALACFVLWVLIQVAGAYFAFGNVAYMAHLGGAIVGLVFWLIDPDRSSNPNPPRRRWRRRRRRRRAPEDNDIT